MSTIFTVGNLTVNLAAGGANVVFVNPDLTLTTIFLTTDQVRALGTAAGRSIATSDSVNYVSITIAGIVLNSLFLYATDMFMPPVMGVNVTVPLSGTGTGQNGVQYLTYLQTEQFFNALSLYSVTNQ